MLLGPKGDVTILGDARTPDDAADAAAKGRPFLARLSPDAAQIRWRNLRAGCQ